jgi:hypothetical protein
VFQIFSSIRSSKFSSNLEPPCKSDDVFELLLYFTPFAYEKNAQLLEGGLIYLFAAHLLIHHVWGETIWRNEETQWLNNVSNYDSHKLMSEPVQTDG